MSKVERRIINCYTCLECKLCKNMTKRNFESGDCVFQNIGKSVKNSTVVDVIENNTELINYIDFIDSNINIIEGDMYTYNSNKKYDLIIIDLSE